MIVTRQIDRPCLLNREKQASGRRTDNYEWKATKKRSCDKLVGKLNGKERKDDFKSNTRSFGIKLF